MKKIISLFLVALLFVFCLSACDSQSKEPDIEQDSVTPEKHQHTYSDAWTFNETKHWRKATCSAEESCATAIAVETEHKFDDLGKCKCGYEKPKPHEHTYSDEWVYNGSYHWHKADCSVNAECESAITDKTAHSFDENGICVCGYEKPEEPVHQHTYSTEWTYDENKHWHKATCSDGEECATAITDESAHTLDSEGRCVCGYVKETEAPKPEEPKPEEPKPEEPKPEEPKPEILGTLNSDYGLILSNGTKIDTNYYPGFVRKALTFTIDDGNVQMDTNFLNIVRPAGIKGTFNLCGANPANAANLVILYEGYEVANHNQLHCLPWRDGFDFSKIEIKDEIFNSSTADVAYMYKTQTPGLYYIDYKQFSSTSPSPYWHPIATNETYTQYVDITKEAIEAVFGEGSVVGYAYPHGQLNAYVKQYLKDNGYLYARDTGLLGDSTGYALPADRFEWVYNANHATLLDAMAKYDAYGDDGELKFFSFGVHSADYKNSWDMLSEFAELYGNRPDEFWYATNREIFEYEDAIKALDINEERIINKSGITVYITVNNVMVKMPAGSTLLLSDIEGGEKTPTPVIDFEDLTPSTLPSYLTTALGSSVANNVGILISEVTKNGKADKVLALTTGPDGSDKITVRRTLKSLDYEAITFKTDILLDTDANLAQSYTIQFKNKNGAIVYQLSMVGDDEGKIGFDDYYRYNGTGIWTVSKSSTGLTSEIMGNWFTLDLEVSKNSENKTVLRIYADKKLVAECSHEAFVDVPLEDYCSVEIYSGAGVDGKLHLDNISFKATERINNDKVADPLAEIMPIKGGANGVVVLVHDDGDITSAKLLDALYEKYGIVGDVALIANRVWDPSTNGPISSAQQSWQALFDNGRWGLINHSMTHAFTGTYDDNGFTIDEDMLYNEVVTSGEVLRQVFPGQRVLTFAYPGFTAVTNVHGKYPTMKQAINLVLKHYVGARNYKGASQSVDKLIYAFTNGRTLGGGQSDLDQIDYVAADGSNAILVFLMHRVVESNPSGNTITSAAARNAIERISDHAKAGNVWSAHFEDAILYLSEAEVATVSSAIEANSIKLTLTHTLDSDIYNYPLTVKVNVSDDWEAVKLTQGDRTVYAVTQTEDGESYVYVDVVPNGNEAILTPVALTDVPAEFIPPVYEAHEHEYSAEWKYDEEKHWYESTCDERIACADAQSGLADHSFGDDGKCECGYEKPKQKTDLGYFDALGGYTYDGITVVPPVYKTFVNTDLMDRLGIDSCDVTFTSNPTTNHLSLISVSDVNTVFEIGRANTHYDQGVAIKSMGGTGDFLVFETDIYISNLSALNFNIGFGYTSDAATKAAMLDYGKYTVTYKETGFDLFGTTVLPETWVNICIELNTADGLIKYYVNGVNTKTATLGKAPEISHVFFYIPGANTRNSYIRLDDTYFGFVSKHLTESDEYYTFNDGNIPSSITKYFKGGTSELKVTDAPGLNTTEKALTVISNSSNYNNNVYFKANENDNAVKAIVEFKYLIQAANEDDHNLTHFFMFSDNNILNPTNYWECRIQLTKDGTLTLNDYTSNGSGHKSYVASNMLNKWITLRFEAYEDENGNFLVDVYMNGIYAFTSQNAKWLSTSVSDIVNLRYYPINTFDGYVYFDDLKCEKVAD